MVGQAPMWVMVLSVEDYNSSRVESSGSRVYARADIACTLIWFLHQFEVGVESVSVFRVSSVELRIVRFRFSLVELKIYYRCYKL